MVFFLCWNGYIQYLELNLQMFFRYMLNIKVFMDYLIVIFLDCFVVFLFQINEKFVLVDVGMVLFFIYFVYILDGSWVRILREIFYMGCCVKNIFNLNSLKKYYFWKYEFEYFELCVF